MTDPPNVAPVAISRRALEQLIEDAMSHLAYWGDDEPPPWHIVEARDALRSDPSQPSTA